MANKGCSLVRAARVLDVAGLAIDLRSSNTVLEAHLKD